jgi:hypothetical protein
VSGAACGRCRACLNEVDVEHDMCMVMAPLTGDQNSAIRTLEQQSDALAKEENHLGCPHRGICVPLDTNSGRAPAARRSGLHHLALDPGWDLLHPFYLQNSIQRLSRLVPY